MVTIRYSLTPSDLAELEDERCGGWVRRSIRIAAGVLFGLFGFFLAWQALFLFPWNRPLANLTFTGMGLLFLWVGFEMPGLNWMFHQLVNPFAECEVQVYEGRIVTISNGKIGQFRWLPKQGLKEKSKFFLLSSFRSGHKLVIPKHSVTPEQEQGLRDLLEREPTDGSPIECSFFLTQKDLNEEKAAAHPWLGSRYGRTFSRVFCTLCALTLPVLYWRAKIGRIFPDLQQLTGEPFVVACVAAFELLCILGTSADFGTKVLNRLNQERRFVLDDRNVSVTRGGRTTIHNWKRFLSYQETANLFVLRTLISEFVTIPKRGLRPGDEEKLRILLSNHLPDKLSAF